MATVSTPRRSAWLFLGPAVVLLAGLVCYPILYTLWLSLHSASGRFVGLDNYATMVTAPETRRAIANNAIWIVAAPSLATALGLMFAVLTERIRRSSALKLILFMPMAISFLSAGVTFRLVYDEDPQRGALNAAIVSVHDVFAPPSRYYGVDARAGAGLVTGPDRSIVTADPVPAGSTVSLPLLGLPADRVPAEAVPARLPDRGPGLSGVVWLDFTRGGTGAAGVIDATERGLPGMTVQARDGDRVVASTQTDAAGRFTFPALTTGSYRVVLVADNFTPPFRGLTWLGPDLVTPAVIGAYVWIWAGFAMMLISAGLAALPRDVVEAARIDGASEWQVFRRVTVPLVRPVLVVVLATLAINVLKIFDLIYVLAPESSQDDANVIALDMYRVSFGGGLNYGLGSALGVLLFVLVLPAMLFNIRRLRREPR